MEIERVKPYPVSVVATDGVPLFAGTDVPVQVLIDHLEIGDSIDGFLAEYPSVERSQVMGFLALARDLVAASLIPPADSGAGDGNGSGIAQLERNGVSAEHGLAHAASTEDAPRDGLGPYVNWDSRPLPDPRNAPLSEIVRGVVEIIGAEGPILAYRAYSLYARAFGLQKIQLETKERFTRALRRALESGDIVLSDETSVDDPAYRFVRIAGAPQVAMRERGDRKIEEIPPLEIAALMHRITPDIPTIDGDGEEWLFRMVLERYELIRMTTHTRSVLQSALALAKDAARWG